MLCGPSYKSAAFYPEVSINNVPGLVSAGGQRPRRPRLGRPDSEVSVSAQGSPPDRGLCSRLLRYRLKVFSVEAFKTVHAAASFSAASRVSVLL